MLDEPSVGELFSLRKAIYAFKDSDENMSVLTSGARLYCCMMQAGMTLSGFACICKLSWNSSGKVFDVDRHKTLLKRHLQRTWEC
jgi:hypothetical protein